MAKKRQSRKKQNWNLEPHKFPICPPFCEDLTEEEQDKLLNIDLHQYYKKAKSFRDIIKLNIDFLRGERASPRYYGSINAGNPESISSLRKIIKINSLGLLSVDSQPGDMEPNYKERAYLAGVSTMKIADHLYEELNHELIVTICPLAVNLFELTNDNHMCGKIVTTYDGEIPFTHVGGYSNYLYHDMKLISSKLANKLLDKAWAVNIIDPTWGRKAADQGHMLDQILITLETFPGTRYRLQLYRPANIMIHGLLLRASAKTTKKWPKAT